MPRIVLILVLVAAILGGVYYFTHKNSPPLASQTNTPQEVPATLPNQPSASPQTLEGMLSALTQRVTNDENSTNTRLANLEKSVNALQSNPTVAPTTNSPSNSSSAHSPLYIPLGWIGSATSQTYTQISTQSITINTADYPGYTSMQFEANIQVYQGNGQAFASLFNSTDGTSILGSVVSTTSQNYNWVTSSSFTLPSGSKTYNLQLQSLTGYTASVTDARIKVNF